jgi:hypothetical protein
MAWEYRGSCKSKEQALNILAEQIEYLYAEKGYINQDAVEVMRGEMEGFAAEWNIPFCWALHEQVLSRGKYGMDTWYDSGCGDSSWNDSGCSW